MTTDGARANGPAWPWRYRAGCTVALQDRGLVLTLRLHNLSDSVMPYGLGWHPYFALTEAMRLDAKVAGRWVLDEALVGRGYHPFPDRRSPLSGVTPAALELDAAYGGWSGRATLHWPEWRARLIMTTTGADTLVVFSPRDADFVCLEPLSNAPNGFNLADVGDSPARYRCLGPGEVAIQRTHFHPAFGS